MPQIQRFTHCIARFSIIILLPQSLCFSFIRTAILSYGPVFLQSSSEKDAEISRLSVQLRTADPEGRREAAMMLSHLKDKGAIPALIQALTDKSSLVRAAVVTALGDLGDSSVVTALTSTLTSDKDVFVRKTAAYTLGRFSEGDSTRALIAALKDKDPEVRGAAAVALGEHADAATISPLISTLSDKNHFVRARGAAALGAIGPAAATAVTTLIALLKSDPDAEVKRHTAAALGSIGDRSALPALHMAARDSDPYLADAARASIRKLER
jgi:HEAT repeat protein